MGATIEVELYGIMTALMWWNIVYTPDTLFVDQAFYADRLLAHAGMDKGNAVITQLPVDAEINPCLPEEFSSSPYGHQNYRGMVGGLAYLASCILSDLTFSVS